MKLALFDFDGTITSRDSLFDFIIYTFGWKRFLIGCLLRSPAMLACALKMIPRDKAKEELLSFHVAGINGEEFKAMGSQYSRKRLPNIIRENAFKKIQWHQLQGHTVAVVSASIECWLADWCKKNDLDLIATRLEVKNKRVTGKFASRNCAGREKIVRIKEKYDLKRFVYIYAYGNSSGDKEMLELADERYYKWKRAK
jgi:phosphatidylglycerophosphatase C